MECDTEGCDRPAQARGLCRRCYARALRRDALPPKDTEKWRAKILEVDGHWMWQGAPNREGYGRISRTYGATSTAHRFIYEALRGPVPDGLVVDHLCRIRMCVNPDHLEPVTHVENVRRGQRAQAVACARGHDYTPENTAISPKGTRRCKACNREKARRRRAQKILRGNAAVKRADSAAILS